MIDSLFSKVLSGLIVRGIERAVSHCYSQVAPNVDRHSKAETQCECPQDLSSHSLSACDRGLPDDPVHHRSRISSNLLNIILRIVLYICIVSSGIAILYYAWTFVDALFHGVLEYLGHISIGKIIFKGILFIVLGIIIFFVLNNTLRRLVLSSSRKSDKKEEPKKRSPSRYDSLEWVDDSVYICSKKIRLKKYGSHRFSSKEEYKNIHIEEIGEDHVNHYPKENPYRSLLAGKRISLPLNKPNRKPFKRLGNGT